MQHGPAVPIDGAGILAVQGDDVAGQARRISDVELDERLPASAQPDDLDVVLAAAVGHALDDRVQARDITAAGEDADAPLCHATVLCWPALTTPSAVGGFVEICRFWRWPRRASDQLHGPVVVAVIAVRVMQAAVHEVVHMVAMGDGLVPAVGAVLMGAMDLRRAVRGIGGTDRDHVLVDVAFVHVMEMAVVQIVHVAVMPDRGVAALRAMLMGMSGMVLLAAGHALSLSDRHPIWTRQ